jgi:hypothetical protein
MPILYKCLEGGAMRAMRVYSAPCAPVPPLRSPLSCLRASRHCLGGGPGPAVCVCVRIERVLRASHIAWGAYPPLLLSGGGIVWDFAQV